MFQKPDLLERFKTGRRQRPDEDHQRVRVLPIAGTRPVPIHVTQLRAGRGAVPGRAISQRGSELRHDTGNTRHRIRSASRTSVKSCAGRADGNGASGVLSLSAAPRRNRY